MSRGPRRSGMSMSGAAPSGIAIENAPPKSEPVIVVRQYADDREWMTVE